MRTLDEIETVLELAFDLKRERAQGIPHPILRDKVLAMLFFFSSTRTRASFEAGMAQLGGHAQFIESRTTQIAHGDTPKEIGQILGRYNDGIAIRHVDWGQGNRYIRDVAAASPVPVFNMQCDLYHPHQALADLMTIIERYDDPRGKTIDVSWAYAASYQKPISVPQSLILLATQFGMNVRLVHPPEFELMPDIIQQAKDNARKSSAGFEIISGFYHPDEGEVQLDGARLTGLPPDRVCRLGVARTFQKLRPFQGLSVLDNVMVGALTRTKDELKKDSPDWEQLAKDVKGFVEMGDVLKVSASPYTSPKGYIDGAAALAKAFGEKNREASAKALAAFRQSCSACHYGNPAK